MVACQIASAESDTAILTTILVACVDVFTRELDVPPPKPYETGQPHHRWHAHRNRLRAHFFVRLLQHFNLLKKDKFERSFPVYNVQRFERGVEH